MGCVYHSWEGGSECMCIVGHNATGTNWGIFGTNTTGEWGTPRTLSSILQENSWLVDTAGDGRQARQTPDGISTSYRLWKKEGKQRP